MKVRELLARVRNRLRDTVGEDADRLWQDFDLVDDAMNEARTELFQAAPDLIVDSTTPRDLDGIPLCRISLAAGVGSYALSQKIIRISRLQLSSQPDPLLQVSQADLPPNWRSLDAGEPQCYCTDIDTDKIYFIPAPKTSDTAMLTVRRFPLTPLTASKPNEELGFREEYHKDLIPKILSIALLTDNSEGRRPEEAARYEAKFMLRAEEIGLEATKRLTGQHTMTPRRAFSTR